MRESSSQAEGEIQVELDNLRKQNFNLNQNLEELQHQKQEVRFKLISS